MFLNKRSVSPLIATILIIVVSVILITVILTWGKGFISDQLSSTNNFKSTFNPDLYQYIKLTDSQNGRFIFSYSPPNTISDHNFTITSYTYNGGHVIPLPEEKVITSPGIFTLDLGIVDRASFFINLILDNNSYLPFNDLTTNVFSPSKSDCPSGFIPVPGNHLYGTVYSKGGFCVAQYEMKMDYNEDGIGDLVSDYPDCYTDSLVYNTWSYLNCSSGTVVSTPEGSPIARITQPQAIAACESLGDNYHLITNDEWMTLARNIEMVPENWSNGVIGSGYIYSGHNDNDPSGALEASINDTDSYYGTNNTTGNQKRTLTLTNGQIIWDLSGNVWEWTDDIVTTSSSAPYRFLDSGEQVTDTTNRYYDYSANGGSGYYISYLELGNLALKYKDLFLLTSGTYNVSSTNGGIGRIYLRGATAQDDRAFLRGGNWSDGANTGLLALSLYGGSSDQGYTVGFRCAVVP